MRMRHWLPDPEEQKDSSKHPHLDNACPPTSSWENSRIDWHSERSKTSLMDRASIHDVAHTQGSRGLQDILVTVETQDFRPRRVTPWFSQDHFGHLDRSLKQPHPLSSTAAATWPCARRPLVDSENNIHEWYLNPDVAVRTEAQCQLGRIPRSPTFVQPQKRTTRRHCTLLYPLLAQVSKSWRRYP